MSNILQIDIDFAYIVTHRTIINFGIDTIYVRTQFEGVSLLIKFLIIYRAAICHFIRQVTRVPRIGNDFTKDNSFPH